MYHYYYSYVELNFNLSQYNHFNNIRNYDHVPACTLYGLGLVQNQVLPLNAIKVLEVCDHQLVASDNDVETGILCVQTLLIPELPQDFSLLLYSLYMSFFNFKEPKNRFERVHGTSYHPPSTPRASIFNSITLAPQLPCMLESSNSCYI